MAATKKIVEMTQAPHLEARKIAPPHLHKKFFWNSCLLCDAKFYHSSKANEHYAGKRHLQKVNSWKRSKNLTVDVKPVTKKPRLDAEHRGSANYRFCKACKLTLTSESHVAEHNKGKKHKKNLLAYRKAGNFDDCNPSFGIGSRCRALAAIGSAKSECKRLLGLAIQNEASFIKEAKTTKKNKGPLVELGKKILESRCHTSVLLSLQEKIMLCWEKFKNDNDQILEGVQELGGEIWSIYMGTGISEVNAVCGFFAEFHSHVSTPCTVKKEYTDADVESLLQELNVVATQ